MKFNLLGLKIHLYDGTRSDAQKRRFKQTNGRMNHKVVIRNMDGTKEVFYMPTH